MTGTGLPVVRLSMWLVLPLTALFVVATAALLVWTKQSGERDLRQRLEGTVEALALASGEGAAPGARLEELAAGRSYERVWVVTAAHQIVASNRVAEVGAPLDVRWRTLLGEARDGKILEDVHWGRRVLLFAAARNAVAGTWAVVLHDTSALRAALHGRMLRAGVLSLVLWLLSCALVVGLVHYVFVQPVRMVYETAQKVGRGERLPEATLQRLYAASSRSVGVLADLMVDQARAQRSYQDNLQEAGALYLALFDLMPALAFVCSYDGFVVEANRAFCDRMGLVRKSILGRPLSSFKALLPIESMLKLAQRSRDERCVFDGLDFVYKRPDGHRIPVTAAVQAIVFQGEPGFLVVAEDRTEARELQRRLASFNDTVELMADERAAAIRQSAVELAEAVRRLEPALEALVRLAEVVAHDADGAAVRPEDRQLLARAARRLHERFQELLPPAGGAGAATSLPEEDAPEEAAEEAQEEATAPAAFVPPEAPPEDPVVEPVAEVPGEPGEEPAEEPAPEADEAEEVASAAPASPGAGGPPDAGQRRTGDAD